MPAQPSIPQPTDDVHAPCKCQIPLDANSEPVTGSAPKKQKSAPKKTGKKKATPAKPVPPKKVASKLVPAKAGPAKRKPSVKIEDVADEDDLTYSKRPHNPHNILKAADGSNDNNDYVRGVWLPGIQVDSRVAIFDRHPSVIYMYIHP